MTECITFVNDNNIIVELPKNLSEEHQILFKDRVNSEKIFRQLITFLINNNIIDKKKNIIDSGAWIGDNTIPWCKNLEGSVYAIDPSKENCDFIKKIAKMNNISNIKIFENGLSNKIETLYTNGNINHCVFQSNDNNNNYKPPHNLTHGNKINNKYSINAVTIDSLFESGTIDNISFIHLDVEGFEYLTLIGAKKVIETFNPIIVFESFLNLKHISGNLEYLVIVKYLSQFNYTTLLINEISGGNPNVRNFISFYNYNDMHEKLLLPLFKNRVLIKI